jgi:hypothetical protein
VVERVVRVRLQEKSHEAEKSRGGQVRFGKETSDKEQLEEYEAVRPAESGKKVEETSDNQVLVHSPTTQGVIEPETKGQPEPMVVEVTNNENRMEHETKEEGTGVEMKVTIGGNAIETVNEDNHYENNASPNSNLKNRSELRKKLVKEYTTPTLKAAEIKAGPFLSDKFSDFGLTSNDFDYFQNESLQYEELKQIDQDTIYYGQKNSKGERHGYGIMLKKTGVKHIGYWKNNSFEPFGRVIDEKGDIYEGNYKNGELNGKGRIITENAVYNGDVVSNKKEGNGIYTKEKEEYDGSFKNNKKEGLGKITFLKTGDTYEGYFKEGKMNGQGTFKWKNGDKYVGDVVNGVFHGKGIYYWKEGTVYDGDYNEGVRKGQGKLTWTNGKYYEGSFENNQPHGEGKITRGKKSMNVKFDQGKQL